MPTFSYKAINERGRKISGTMIAANDADLEKRLEDLGLELIRLKEMKEGKTSSSFFSKVGIKDLTILFLHLEQLDRAGVPILESLADVRDSSQNPKLRDIISSSYEAVKGGKMLSEAFGDHPKIFNNVYVGLIAAGERTGDLSGSFQHLIGHMKWTDQMRRKVKKAVSYPAVMFFVMSGVITLMMLFVVPQMVGFLKSQGFELPVHTRALIATSDFFAEYWYIIIGGPVLLFFLNLTLYRKIESFAYFMDAVFLKLPVMGDTLRKIELARFTHFFGVLFRSGIDILDCLESANGVIRNRVLKEAVILARRSVSEGNTLTDSLRASSQFPSLVIKMFKVGEDSGNLKEALENINYFYEREVNDSVDRAIGMIQPTLIVVMGAMVMWVASSIFGPLYDSFSNLNM